MNSFPITGEEFMATWAAAGDKVFRRGEFLFDPFPATSPFVQAWNAVGLPYQMGNCWAPIVNWDPNAEIERFSDLPFLLDTLTHFGIDEFIWTSHWHMVTPENWVCPTVPEALYAARWKSHFLASAPSTLFSRDATWGLLSTEEDVSILGGTPEFMAVYLKKAGGIEAVKARFQFDDVIRGGWPSVLRNVTQDRIDRFYAMLGWEPPDYEEGWRRLGLAK